MSRKKGDVKWDIPLASGQTPEKVLEDLYYSGMKDKQAARILTVMVGQKVTLAALKCKRQALGLAKDNHGIPLVTKSRHAVYDDPPVMDGDVLVLADSHVPFHDAVWINRCIGLALHWGIKNLVLAGDVLDFHALCSFAPYFDEAGKAFTEELEDAAQFFDALAAFKDVLWFAGGHERRFLRRMMVAMGMDQLADLVTQLKQLRTSPYHQAIIHSGGKTITLVHPKNYSRIPARVPTFLCRKYRTPVAGAHDHVWGINQDESGIDWACSIGVTCDPKRLNYVALEPKTNPAVSQGALIIRDGFPWLLHPRFTDFRALRLMAKQQ